MPPEEKFGANNAPDPKPEAKRPQAKKPAEAYIVTERADRAVPVRHSTVIFRRDQVISDPYLIAIARENHIRMQPIED